MFSGASAIMALNAFFGVVSYVHGQPADCESCFIFVFRPFRSLFDADENKQRDKKRNINDSTINSDERFAYLSYPAQRKPPFESPSSFHVVIRPRPCCQVHCARVGLAFLRRVLKSAPVERCRMRGRTRSVTRDGRR